MRTHTCRWVMLVLLLVMPLAQAGTKHYYYTDPQGTVLAKADAQGNIVATYDYAPYGAQVLGTPPSGPTGYTGHVNDAESGLVYMQQRYYDSTMGRFLSIDAVEPSPGKIYKFNRYMYASNNPVINIDPDGRDDVPFGDCSKNPNCTVEIDNRNGDMNGQGSNASPLSSVPILGQAVGISYNRNVSPGGKLTASEAIAAAAALINIKSNLLTKNEINAIKEITSIVVTGAQSYLGATSGHAMAISVNYIRQVSTAWLASIFGHEGQHHLNGGRYAGKDAWRDEESAGRIQLSIGRKIGFSKTEVDYLEDYIDPINHQDAMQKHMENGYGF